MPSARRLPARMSRFAREERGSISVWSLCLFLTAGVIGAVAVDVNHMFSARSQLQVAADVAAHAAILRRNTGSTNAATAKANAISVASATVPPELYGDVLEESQIVFGTYNIATDSFSSNPSSKSAVFVVAERDTDDGNPVGTFLWRLAGVSTMDVGASAVAIAYHPSCAYDGFLAEGTVDVTSGNLYTNGFCMHSQTCVDLQNGNNFWANTTVSMPDLNCFEPDRTIQETYNQNPGLEDALHEDSMQLKVLDLLRPTLAAPNGEIWYALQQAGSLYRPAYITTTTVNSLNINSNTDVTTASFTQNAVNIRTCSSSSQTLKFTATNGTTFQNFVLLTNCQIDFSGALTVQDAIIYTTNTGSTSVRVSTAGGGGNGGNGGGNGNGGNSQPNGFNIGRPENPACQSGGGAQILTRGGFRNSAAMTMSGGQIISLGNVDFAANAGGNGASIVSGGTIEGTSNMTFNGCPTGNEQKITVPYFRLVR